MAHRFAKVLEEEIVAINEAAFSYPSDLVNTKTTIPLRIGEERWIYTSPSGDSCIIYRNSMSHSQGLITWRISSRAEISDRLLKQILWKPNCRLQGEGFSPGCSSARAENLKKSHVIETEFQPGPKKEREHAHLLCFRTSVNFLTEICVLRPGWNWAYNHNNISAWWAEQKFSPGWNSPCNQALRLWVWAGTCRALHDENAIFSPRVKRKTNSNHFENFFRTLSSSAVKLHCADVAPLCW